MCCWSGWGSRRLQKIERRRIVLKLSTAETELFYKLHNLWLAFANRELQIMPKDIPAEQIRRQPIELVARLRDAAYARPDLLEQYLADNPDRLPPDELLIVAGWRHRLEGEFYIMRHLKAYSVLMSLMEPIHLYGVLGLYDPIEVVLGGAPLPVLVEAVLLPFRDRIIYDGLLRPYPIAFGRTLRSGLNKTYSRLKEREGIIEALIGPDGQPLIRTSLARKAPARPAPDWRPAIDEIVAQTEKMRHAQTKLQAAAFALLRASANLAQAALQEQGAEDEAIRRMKAVRRAMTKLEQLLSEEEW
jgi:hypothetical protein